MKTEQPHAEYVEHMGSDLSVVNAARQSFDKQKTVFDHNDTNLIQFLATGMRTKDWDIFLDNILNITDKEKLKSELIAYKRKAQHWAPFAHPHATIRVRLPLFLARQFVKHQIGGTWSEESRRYLSSEVSYYFPDNLHSRPEDIKQGSDAAHKESDYILDGMKAITDDLDVNYQTLISKGVAPEEARMLLPLNSMTGITWTGSLLFWARVVTQRIDPHAQKAAQDLAKQIDDILRPLYPVSWEALVGNVPE